MWVILWAGLRINQSTKCMCKEMELFTTRLVKRHFRSQQHTCENTDSIGCYNSYRRNHPLETSLQGLNFCNFYVYFPPRNLKQEYSKFILQLKIFRTSTSYKLQKAQLQARNLRIFNLKLRLHELQNWIQNRATFSLNSPQKCSTSEPLEITDHWVKMQKCSLYYSLHFLCTQLTVTL